MPADRDDADVEASLLASMIANYDSKEAMRSTPTNIVGVLTGGGAGPADIRTALMRRLILQTKAADLDALMGLLAWGMDTDNTALKDRVKGAASLADLFDARHRGREVHRMRSGKQVIE